MNYNIQILRVQLEANKRKIIYLSIALSILLFIVLLTRSSNENLVPTCELGSELPDKNWNDLPAVSSKNFNALVKINAYLEYMKLVSNGSILILDLHSVDAEQSEDVQRLILNTNCAKLRFEFGVKANSIFGIYIHLDLHKHNKQQTQCSINNPGDIDFRPQTHYECRSRMKFACFAESSSEKIHVVNLIIEQFEFEMFGDSSSYEKSQFSYPVRTCEIKH